MVYVPPHLNSVSALPCKTDKLRTAHLRIGRVTQSDSCGVKQLILFLQSYAPNSPDLNPIDHKILGIMQQRVYENGESVCRRVFARREDTSNICRRLFR